ncbi:MAG: hypothetical protein V4726_02790 [Verrucomicrobiota bacterium]
MSLPPPRRPLKSRSLRRRRQSPSVTPAVVVDDPPSLAKLLRSLLGLLVIGGILGGGLWFYVKGMKQTIRITENINNGLKAIAAEIWANGMAPEIEDIDPDLTLTFMQLKKKAGGNPPRVVVIEDPEASFAGRRPTHQIIYMLGRHMVITLNLFYDFESGKIEILGYELGPNFQDVIKDHSTKKAAQPVSPVPGETSPPSDQKPVTEDKAGSEENPISGNQPAAEENPAPGDKPVTEENAVPEENPAAESQPAVEDKPVTEDKPATENFPAVK